MKEFHIMLEGPEISLDAHVPYRIAKRILDILSKEGLAGDKLSQAFTGEDEIPIDAGLHAASTAAAQAVEAKMIKRVLRETGNNKTKTARILHVSYKTLLTKIKDYGLDEN